MGLFDKLLKLGEAVEGINEVAEDISRETVEDYGEPVYCLYTALELGELHRRIDITDDQNNVKYYTKSSIVAITGKTDIMDAEGNVIAHLEKRPVSLHEKHFITMADGRKFMELLEGQHDQGQFRREIRTVRADASQRVDPR